MPNEFSTQRVRLEGQFFAKLHRNEIKYFTFEMYTTGSLYAHIVGQSKSACMKNKLNVQRAHASLCYNFLTN
jgi:hypothetical protein